jgi:formylglycine-generating enzyme required for sulfatase activity
MSLRAGGYLSQTTTFDVLAFEIAQYPLTNAQFEKFVKAEGYTQQQWWTAGGWQVRQRGGWREPRYWQESKRNKPDHPVAGVSWYEATVFCQWLSDVTGEHITLPTEQQWQRAAQGDDNRAYPWGNTFGASRCNSSVGKTSHGTTPVLALKARTKAIAPLGLWI